MKIDLTRRGWTTIRILLLLMATSCAWQVFGQQAATHNMQVQKNGESVMGFPQDKATHHFRLYEDGGAIEISADDAKDTQTRDAIRMHLPHIAKMFSEGDFNAPMLIHGQVPPGVPVLERLKTVVVYRYEEMPQGGRVSIKTQSPEALKAVHDFLRFQINEHHTGDSSAVSAK